MSTPCQHLCIPLFALLPESTHLCLSTESQHQRLQWCCLPTVSSAYSAVSLCLHFCQPLSGIVWLLTGLDTSHPIFSWSYNDWHNNMFQLTASITTVQCLMNRCWLFPWILFNVQCMIANKCFYHSFISGSSRLSISPTKGHKVAINGIFAIDNWSLY